MESENLYKQSRTCTGSKPGSNTKVNGYGMGCAIGRAARPEGGFQKGDDVLHAMAELRTRQLKLTGNVSDQVVEPFHTSGDPRKCQINGQ
jgi:hypothetical protein